MQSTFKGYTPRPLYASLLSSSVGVGMESPGTPATNLGPSLVPAVRYTF